MILHREDFAKLPAAEKHEIPVLQFVPSEQIDPILFDKSYYLEPDSTTPKAYVLLARTLEEIDKTAWCTSRCDRRRAWRRYGCATGCWCCRRCCGPTRSAPPISNRSTTSTEPRAAGDQDGRNPRRHDVR